MTNTAIPAGYKQTEVGIIPEDWEVKSLGGVASFKTGPFGSTLHKTDYIYDGVPIINPMHIIDGGIFPSPEMSVSESIAKRLTDFRLSDQDIIIGRRGDIGRCAVILEGSIGWLCGTGSMIIRPSPLVNADFLQRVLSSPEIISKITEASVGTTMVNLNQKSLSSLKIQFPSFKEQTAIATILSDVDALIASLNAQIAKKRDIKTATMQQLLTGKQRLAGFGEGKGMKPSELGEIPEDWEVEKLDNLSGFITKGSTPTTYGFGWEKTGILFLRSECVSENGLDLSESMYISSKAHGVLKRSEVHAGDILITITGNVGRVIYLSENFGEANINQHIARIRIASLNANGLFIYHFLSQKLVRDFFSKITTGLAYPQLSLVQVRETTVLLPKIKEQEAIAGVLSAMDEEIAALEQRLAKTKAMKQGMMQELLTGRTRLVVGSTKPSPFDLYEQTKRENFVHSSRLEGIHMPMQKPETSLADVLAKYRAA